MSDFLKALDAEIAGLERELQSNPLYVKLEQARRLRATYSVPQHTAKVAPPSLSKTAARPFASGASAEILRIGREVMAGRSTPTPTREVLRVLQEQDVHIGGATPQNVVSSILSKSDEFVSHGRSGWTLTSHAEDREKGMADDADPGGSTSSGYKELRLDQPQEPHAKGREAGPGGGT